MGGVTPVDEEGDCVFCAGGAGDGGGGGDAETCGGADEGGCPAGGGYEPFADVDVVGVEIVGYVGFDAGPGGEGGELGFWLGHIGVEVVERAETGCAVVGVGVGWVEAFVVLDVHEDVVFAGEL